MGESETLIVNVPFSEFIKRVKHDDVQSVAVDGMHISFSLKPTSLGLPGELVLVAPSTRQLYITQAVSSRCLGCTCTRVYHKAFECWLRAAHLVVAPALGMAKCLQRWCCLPEIDPHTSVLSNGGKALLDSHSLTLVAVPAA